MEKGRFLWVREPILERRPPLSKLSYIRLSDKRKKQAAAADGQRKTANEFVNVKDIKGKYLYTRDQLVLCYLKINPITIDLFSKGEKHQLVKQLTASMSGIQHPFKFLAVSRPVDITPLISELSAALATSDPKQKELLKQEILEMTTFALSGEVVERQLYIVLWEKADEGAEKELLVKAKDFAGNLDDCGIGCEILEQQNIVRRSMLRIWRYSSISTCPASRTCRRPS
ncbi:hypothetical protein JCM17380_34140 [Desulfosporosinus burensis]